MLHKMKLIFFVVLFVFLNGCIKERENSDRTNVKISIVEENNITTIYSKEDIMGIELSVKGNIDEGKISVKSDKMKIVYYDGEKTNIAIAAKTGKIAANDEIIKIDGITIDRADVLSFVKNISAKANIETKPEIEMLGDYNKDKILDINDFMQFSQNYGKTNSEIDISPAEKGIGVASDIYCKRFGDGLVNLEDLVVFAFNFGKSAPIDKMEITTTKTSISIGENLLLSSKAYSNNEEKEIEVLWSIKGENSCVKIDSTGLITGLSAGSATISVKSFGIENSINIVVNEQISGGYYSDGNYVAYFKNQPDDTKAINVIVMGDGYVKEDLKKGGSYEIEAKKIIDGLFKYAPFSQHKNNFNAYIIFCESKESGSDHTQNVDDIDTVFNSNYGQNGIDRLLVIKNYAKVTEYISNAGLTSKNAIGKNIMVISVNDTKYGGSGGTYSVISKHANAVDIAAHEIGHSFGGLADEYDYGETFAKSNAKYQKNVDLTNNLKEIKWSYFIGLEGYSNVGAYEGAYYYKDGVWRPTQTCLMKELEQQFCPICREAIVKVIDSCIRKEYVFSEFIAEDKVNLVASKTLDKRDMSYPEMFPDDLRVIEIE